VEKPDLSVAKQLLDVGMHLWNAGIFLFSTATIIDAFAKHAPKTLEETRATFETAKTDLAFTRLGAEA
jgi:mannose-1-phosphate guanylyltransferase / mannose-6-phosphate isomerase